MIFFFQLQLTGTQVPEFRKYMESRKKTCRLVRYGMVSSNTASLM